MRPHVIILLPHRTRLRPQLIASSCMIHRRGKYGRYTPSFRLSHTVHRRYELTYIPGTQSSRQDLATSLVYFIDGIERFVTAGGSISQPIDHTPTLTIYSPHFRNQFTLLFGISLVDAHCICSHHAPSLHNVSLSQCFQGVLEIHSSFERDSVDID
jgi:hypothetical protein